MRKDPEQEWRERFRAVAAAHGRYLWLLLITGIFYLALHFDIASRSSPRTNTSSDSRRTALLDSLRTELRDSLRTALLDSLRRELPNSLRTKLPDSLRTELPIVGLSVDSRVVRATGPFVLGLIALAALGTFPAIRRAYEKTGRSRHDFEQLDTAPTAIDFAVYTTPKSPRWTRIGLATYPAFVTLVVIEAVWLWWQIKSDTAIGFGGLFLVLGAVVLVFSLLRLATVWKSEIRDMLTNLRRSA